MFKDDLALRLLLYFYILAIEEDVKFTFKVDVLFWACVIVTQRHNTAFSEILTLILIKSVCLEYKHARNLANKKDDNREYREQ
jgi:hypothetical protein